MFCGEAGQNLSRTEQSPDDGQERKGKRSSIMIVKWTGYNDDKTPSVSERQRALGEDDGKQHARGARIEIH